MSKILIIEARFYEQINDHLIAGARAVLEEAKAEIDHIVVPGSLEIPTALKWAADNDQYDGYVLLGCVKRGETMHDVVVAENCYRLVADLSIEYDLAVGNGVLTVNTEEQALDRADAKRQDRGGAAARAALRMIEIRKQFA